MFTDIEQYILLPREQRRSHLRLDEACIEIGGYDSREYRGLLAHHLGTTIPTRKKVILCHACNNHKCSNTKHLYWGTFADNTQDQRERGTFKSPYARLVDKYGEEGARDVCARTARAVGKRGHNRYSEAQLKALKEAVSKVDQGTRGWIARLSRELKLSHSQVRRLVNKYISRE